MITKPLERLAHAPQFTKLREYQLYGLGNPPIFYLVHLSARYGARLYEPPPVREDRWGVGQHVKERRDAIDLGRGDWGVTADSLRRAVARYLDPDRRVTLSIVPQNRTTLAAPDSERAVVS